MRYSIKMCCRRRKRDHEIITTTMIEKKDSPKTDRLRKKPMSVPLRGDKLLLFCVASCFHLFLLEYRVILEKERGKSRKGKKHQICKRKKTHQIIDIRQSSGLRAVSPFRFSLSREYKKNFKKSLRLN